MIYIVLRQEPYEGMWPFLHAGDDTDPLPSFLTENEAKSWAKKKRLARYETEILSVAPPQSNN